MGEAQDTGLVARIESELRRRIVTGDLPGGAHLRQDHLAAEFGVAAVPVREALRRLENARLVISRPRRGVVVTPVEAADALEVAEMRAALEGRALQLALPRQQPSDWQAAEAAIAEAEAGGSIADWLDANRRFHAALYAPCAMPRLLAAIADLWLSADRHLYLVWAQVDYGNRSQDEHRALLAACRAGDGPLAARLLEDHISEAGRTLAALL